jgi:hypothetical protein
LTTLTDRLRIDDLARVAAALQVQVLRDFAPIWRTTAMITAAPFEALPAGYCPIIVQDTLDAPGVHGFHRTRADDTPYVLIPYGPTWSLSASHALLCMLANPTGSERRPGLSSMRGQGIVEHMLDICAPCQDIACAYAIDGVVVSDFCTPAFFGDGLPCPPYSVTGALQQPLRPAPGGQTTWLADDGLLYQARAGSSGKIQVHGGFASDNRGKQTMRERVDILTPDRLRQLSASARTAELREAEQDAMRVRFTNLERFRNDIAWRFGHADTMEEPVPPAAAERRGGRIKGTYLVPRPEHQAGADRVRTTARTAS